MATEWTAQVVMATDEHIPNDVLVSMSEAAEKWEATVGARGVDGPGFRLTADVETEHPHGAAMEAERLAARLAQEAVLDVEVVEVSACIPEVFEAHAFRPDTPELLSAVDVAEELGVSRQRVWQLAHVHPGFPAPYARLGTGPVWTLPVIEHFRDTWDRRPGRRPAEMG